MLKAKGWVDIHKYTNNSGPTVQMAQIGISQRITQYVVGRGIIRHAEIMKNLETNLVSAAALVEMKRTIILTDQGAYITQNESNTTQKTKIGNFNSNTKMWTMDINTMFEADNETTNDEGNSNNASKQPRTHLVNEVKVRHGDRIPKRVIRKAFQQHIALRHLPFNTMAICIENGAWNGTDAEVTPSVLRLIAEKNICVMCSIGRKNQQQYEGTGVQTPKEPGEAFEVDLLGPYSPPSRGTCNNLCTYAYRYIDIGSGFRRTYGARNLSPSVRKGILRKWIIYFASYGWHVRKGQMDFGSTESAETMRAEAAIYGIHLQPRPAQIPAPTVERSWQTAANDVATTLASTPTMRKQDWLPILQDCDDVRCIVPNAASERAGGKGVSPYEVVTGDKPDINIEEGRRLGTIVVVKRHENQRGTFPTRNEAGRVIGIYRDGTKAVDVQYLDTGRVQRRGHIQAVSGIEEIIGDNAHRREVSITRNPRDGHININYDGAEVNTTSSYGIQQEVIKQLVRQEEEEERDIASVIKGRNEEATAKEAIPAMTTSISLEPEKEHITTTETRASMMVGASEDQERSLVENEQRQHFWQEFYKDKNLVDAGLIQSIHETYDNTGHWANGEQVYYVMKARVTHTGDNPTIAMVEGSVELEEIWLPVIHKEFQGMLDKRAIREILEEDAKAGTITRHVTVLLTKSDGRLKCRINIDGRSEKRSQIFDEKDLYSPAMDEELLKIVLSYIAYYKMESSHSDVEQCFLHNRMDEAEYRRRIVIHLKPIECGKAQGGYYETDSVIYGCPDASKEWFKHYCNFMTTQEPHGWKHSQYYQCLWIWKGTTTTSRILMAVATDDIPMGWTTDKEAREEAARIKAAMDEKWTMTHKPLDEIIGVKITTNPDGSMTLTQPAQLKKIQETLFADKVVPEIYAPARTKQERMKDSDKPVSITTYKSTLGVLMYLRITRPDVRAGFGIAGEVAHNPNIREYNDLIHLGAMLVTTAHIGTTLYPGEVDEATRMIKPMKIRGSCDASWSTSKTSQSRLGIELKIGHKDSGSTIARSNRERGTSPSAATAELHAAVDIVMAEKMLRGVITEIGGGVLTATIQHSINDEKLEAIAQRIQPTTIKEDNLSLLNILKYESEAKKLRTFTRELNIVKQSMQDLDTYFELVTSEQQDSDILTKSNTSQTEHWRRAAEVLGAHKDVEHLRKLTETRGKQRKPAGKIQSHADEDGPQ